MLWATRRKLHFVMCSSASLVTNWIASSHHWSIPHNVFEILVPTYWHHSPQQLWDGVCSSPAQRCRCLLHPMWLHLRYPPVHGGKKNSWQLKGNIGHLATSWSILGKVTLTWMAVMHPKVSDLLTQVKTGAFLAIATHFSCSLSDLTHHLTFSAGADSTTATAKIHSWACTVQQQSKVVHSM